MSNPDQLSKSALMQFTGTAHGYRHALNREIVFTDGAGHVAAAPSHTPACGSVRFRDLFNDTDKRQSIGSFAAE